MRILLISGGPSSDACGVRDYTFRLGRALASEGLDVQQFDHRFWRLRDARAMLKAVDQVGADIIHIQYPARAYGRGLGPQLLSCRRPGVVTIHEVSQAHPLRKLSLYGFLCTAKRVIFTSRFELQAAARLAPWVRSRSGVIPIGSNITVDMLEAEPTAMSIGYFGLIRPAKGLEQVITLARLAVQKADRFKVLIIGSEVQGQGNYYQQLRKQSIGLPVEWRVGLEGANLNAALRECGVAYLPFPDGASERRSTLLTFLGLGIPVITTEGPQTTVDLRSAVRFAATPRQALQIAENLLADRDARSDLRKKGAAYARIFQWDGIARRHIELYRQLCAACPAPAGS